MTPALEIPLRLAAAWLCARAFSFALSAASRKRPAPPAPEGEWVCRVGLDGGGYRWIRRGRI